MLEVQTIEYSLWPRVDDEQANLGTPAVILATNSKEQSFA